jgi:hypothetical protein
METMSKKKVLNILAGILLLFNGTGAIYGGVSLIAAPDGSGLQMGVEWLEQTPFDNYLIPGIILLAVNGIFSFVCLGMMLIRNKQYGRYVVVQGVLLCGWIGVQILLIRTVNMLHIVMAATGLILTVCGAGIIRVEQTDKEHSAR